MQADQTRAVDGLGGGPGGHNHRSDDSDSNGFERKDSTMGAPLDRRYTSIQLTPEQFERMYLQPQNQVKGDLRKMFGNPTPVGLGGFNIALTPLVCQFMGWRGTMTAEGLPTFGQYIFMGGLLAILASIGEFILGNTFPSIFFGVYGSFFLTYGITLIPSMGAVTTFGATAISAEMNDIQAQAAAFQAGAQAPPFLASIGFFSLFTALFTFMLLVASLRTNAMFVGAFFTLALAFTFFAVSRFLGANGDMEGYEHYQMVAGACGFCTTLFGWYLLFVEILAAVDFPINLPVFDLSGVIPGASEKAQKKRDAERGMQRY